MEDKKNAFIAYLDDDDSKKEIWCEILKETVTSITFKYRSEEITIPYHRVLKVKKKGERG